MSQTELTKRIRIALPLFCLLACALLMSPARGNSFGPTKNSDSEYGIKAALTFKITQFVQWPESAFEGKDDRFEFGILGEDPFGPSLDELLAERTIAGRKISIQRFAKMEDLVDCHLLFVTRAESGRVRQILKRLEGRPVLLVGEKERFANNGGIINFKSSRRGRMEFEVNTKFAGERGLEISPELLRLGKEIR